MLTSSTTVSTTILMFHSLSGFPAVLFDRGRQSHTQGFPCRTLPSSCDFCGSQGWLVQNCCDHMPAFPDADQETSLTYWLLTGRNVAPFKLAFYSCITKKHYIAIKKKIISANLWQLKHLEFSACLRKITSTRSYHFQISSFLFNQPSIRALKGYQKINS